MKFSAPGASSGCHIRGSPEVEKRGKWIRGFSAEREGLDDAKRKSEPIFRLLEDASAVLKTRYDQYNSHICSSEEGYQ